MQTGGLITMLSMTFLLSVFDCIEMYAPGFKASVIGRDILTPPDLEEIFGLTGGVSGESFLDWKQQPMHFIIIYEYIYLHIRDYRWHMSRLPSISVFLYAILLFGISRSTDLNDSANRLKLNIGDAIILWTAQPFNVIVLNRGFF